MYPIIHVECFVQTLYTYDSLITNCNLKKYNKFTFDAFLSKICLTIKNFYLLQAFDVQVSMTFSAIYLSNCVRHEPAKFSFSEASCHLQLTKSPGLRGLMTFVCGSLHSCMISSSRAMNTSHSETVVKS